MVQSAIVKKQIKEGVVEVSLLRQVECGLSCSGNCAGCMQKPQGELLALASDPIGTKPGERVEVEPSAGHSIGLSALVFGVPCIFLALGYLAGMALGSWLWATWRGWPWDWERGPRWGLRPWACWWASCPPCGSTAGSPAARSRNLSSCAIRRKAVDACSATSGLSGRN